MHVGHLDKPVYVFEIGTKEACLSLLNSHSKFFSKKKKRKCFVYIYLMRLDSLLHYLEVIIRVASLRAMMRSYAHRSIMNLVEISANKQHKYIEKSGLFAGDLYRFFFFFSNKVKEEIFYERIKKITTEKTE